MTEYDSEMDLNHVVKTQSGDQIGTVTQVYDNTTGAGEQVYAVVKNPNEKAEDVRGKLCYTMSKLVPNSLNRIA